MKKITTVLGDIAPEELGFTLAHEHTFMTFTPMWKNWIPAERPVHEATIENLTRIKTDGEWMGVDGTMEYDDFDAEVAEMESYKALGGSAIVECTVPGMKHREELNKELSEKTGIKIVASTGYYCVALSTEGKVNPFDKPALKAHMHKEIAEGIEGCDFKAGVIKMGFGLGDAADGGYINGKISNGFIIGKDDLAIYDAECEVAAETGYPITVHPFWSRDAVTRIVDIALDKGIAPDKVDICHLAGLLCLKASNPSGRDYLADPTAAIDSFVDWVSKDVLDKGVFINFDGWGQFHTGALNFDWGATWSVPDTLTIGAVIKLIERGYASQIMFGHDKAGSIFNYHNGAFGYTRVPTFVVPTLNSLGFEEATKQIMIANPAKFLAHD